MSLTYTYESGTDLGSLHSSEANVVLLNDGGVQRVEVQQQYKLVVQSLLGLQNQSSRVLRSFAALFGAAVGFAVRTSAAQLGQLSLVLSRRRYPNRVSRSVRNR
jgi:hypothetical protein